MKKAVRQLDHREEMELQEACDWILNQSKETYLKNKQKCHSKLCRGLQRLNKEYRERIKDYLNIEELHQHKLEEEAQKWLSIVANNKSKADQDPKCTYWEFGIIKMLELHDGEKWMHIGIPYEAEGKLKCRHDLVFWENRNPLLFKELWKFYKQLELDD